MPIYRCASVVSHGSIVPYLGTASHVYILGEFKIDNCFDFFLGSGFDTLSRNNNLSQIFYFRCCELALINIIFEPDLLESINIPPSTLAECSSNDPNAMMSKLAIYKLCRL